MTEDLQKPTEQLEPEPYRTSDTPYAAYLHYSGVLIVGTRQDPNDIKRKVYVFVYSEDVPKLEQQFHHGSAPVEAKRYYKSYKIVTRFLRDN
jgi:hypothetical protein